MQLGRALLVFTPSDLWAMTSFTGANLAQERQRLVYQIQRQGIRDRAVFDAMRDVPREAFLPPELHEFAYQNTPLPIGHEQTISQPLVVAIMTVALELQPTDRVLEIGTGSGYAAAVLSRIAKEVYTVERYPELVDMARARLQEEGFENVHVSCGDGTLGWPENAPYQAVVVAAGGPEVPQSLLNQLDVGGRLVIPVGRRGDQQLLRIRRVDANRLEQDDLGQVRFVPLIGDAGWDGATETWYFDPSTRHLSRNQKESNDES